MADRNLEAYQQQLREVAEAHGVTYERALADAIDAWLKAVGEEIPGICLNMPEKAGVALAAFVDALRL